MPLDVTHAARRALAVGATLATQINARLEVVTVRGAYGVDPKEAWGLAGSVKCHLDDVEVIDSRLRDQALADLTADHDTLLCVASHGRSAVGELIMGSVSAAVVRQAAAPLILVGPHAPEQPPAPFHDVLVGFDGDGHESSRLLAETVRWAGYGLRPWLAQVLSVRSSPDVPTDVAETASLEQAARTLRVRGVEAEWEVLHCRRTDSQSVAHALMGYGEALDNPISVVATHGRTGFAHLTLGSVASTLVHHAPWPVVVIPPRGTIQQGTFTASRSTAPVG